MEEGPQAPLRLHTTTVAPEWVDYNGHMSEWCYLLVFGDSADAFFRYLGIDDDYRASGRSIYTVETRLWHLREASLGDPLACSLQLLDHDDRRLHIFHEMTLDDVVIAAAEQLLVHVDMTAARSNPMPEDLHARVEAVQHSHRTLDRPERAGHPMGIRHKQEGS